MPSKEFLDFQSQIPTMPPIGDLPGGPIQENIPPEFASLGVPILPPDYTSPEPVIPSDFFGGKTEVNGVPGLHVMRGDVRAGCAHLYIHGGGFTIGSAMTSGEFLAYFLEKTGLEGYAVEYRLALYHPFPAAITDCLEFYQGLLNMGYDRIVVGGESAGASLTLGLVHALKMENLPLPAAIWCSSPVDDISYGERETYKTDMFTECSEGVRKAYAPDGDLKDPRISPIYGDFSGFPPMFIQAGGAESLVAGTVRLVTAAAKADNEVLLHIGKGMPHTFAMDYQHYPEANNAMNEFTTFINNILDVGLL